MSNRRMSLHRMSSCHFALARSYCADECRWLIILRGWTIAVHVMDRRLLYSWACVVFLPNLRPLAFRRIKVYRRIALYTVSSHMSSGSASLGVCQSWGPLVLRSASPGVSFSICEHYLRVIDLRYSWSSQKVTKKRLRLGVRDGSSWRYPYTSAISKLYVSFSAMIRITLQCECCWVATAHCHIDSCSMIGTVCKQCMISVYWRNKERY